CCSVFSLAKRTLPCHWRDACSNCGAIILQGPHQLAQKSTSTGTSLRPVWAAKFCPVNSNIWSGHKGCLQAPQLPPATSLSSGTRFTLSQCGQTTCLISAEITLPHEPLSSSGSRLNRKKSSGHRNCSNRQNYCPLRRLRNSAIAASIFTP